MAIIGITGGIGSGKTTVAKRIEEKGFPVYYSDIRAKAVMIESPTIKNQLIEWYGENIYLPNGELNRKKLAEEVFNSTEKLNQLNQLVHPEVFNDFKSWKRQQNQSIVFKEAAILYESGSYKDCDAVITISARKAIRIARTIERDNLSIEEINKRIDKQWTDQQREKKSEYIIHNNKDLESLYSQVDEVLLKIISLYK